MHYVIGIDEAGRGPWAGPIVVGGFLMRSDITNTLEARLNGLNDSKQITPKRREILFSTIEYMHSVGECQYSFAYRDAQVIDKFGIREANRLSMQDVILTFLSCLKQDDTAQIYIDGCDNYVFGNVDAQYLFAKKRKGQGKQEKSKETDIIEWDSKNSDLTLGLKPSIISSQVGEPTKISYIIGGDGSIPIVSAASIVAKVLRDRIMCDFSQEFPEYGFDEHKGYGTVKHRQAILNYGITPLHRKSYAPIERLIFHSTDI